MDLRDLLGTELPLIQAPMAGAQNHLLAAAVCEAGGLGSIPAGMLDARGLETELAAIEALTERPYNVNFFCHQAPVNDPARIETWHQLLAPWFAEFGVDPASIPVGPTRQPFDAAMAEVLERHRPALVSFHFGLPSPELLQRARATGAKIASSATTLEEGLWLQQHGVDLVIAQGLEAGGHRGIFLNEDLTNWSKRWTCRWSPPAASPIARAWQRPRRWGRQAYNWAPPTCCARKAAPMPCTAPRCKARVPGIPR